jgi:hypothetical protein
MYTVYLCDDIKYQHATRHLILNDVYGEASFRTAEAATRFMSGLDNAPIALNFVCPQLYKDDDGNEVKKYTISASHLL